MKEAGYSLLELIVVMAIMALVIGIGGARMFTSIEAARFDATTNAAVSRIRILRAQAYLDGRPITLGTTQAGATPADLDLPQGWTVDMTPVEISATGACSGGTLRLASPEGRTRSFTINAPDCRATRL